MPAAYFPAEPRVKEVRGKKDRVGVGREYRVRWAAAGFGEPWVLSAKLRKLPGGDAAIQAFHASRLDEAGGTASGGGGSPSGAAGVVAAADSRKQQPLDKRNRPGDGRAAAEGAGRSGSPLGGDSPRNMLITGRPLGPAEDALIERLVRLSAAATRSSCAQAHPQTPWHPGSPTTGRGVARAQIAFLASPNNPQGTKLGTAKGYGTALRKLVRKHDDYDLPAGKNLCALTGESQKRALATCDACATHPFVRAASEGWVHFCCRRRSHGRSAVESQQG